MQFYKVIVAGQWKLTKESKREAIDAARVLGGRVERMSIEETQAWLDARQRGM